MPLELEPPPARPSPAALSQDANEIEDDGRRHVPTGFEAWDEVLGGGLVLGATLVLFGHPGSRKSTWAAAIADSVAFARRGRALYLCAEMPSYQVRDAAKRLSEPRALSIVGSERDAAAFSACVLEVERLRPRVVVYDSIQSFEAEGQSPGSDYAIRAVVTTARRLAAVLGHSAILVSQVNKSGAPAGPYKTIHDCDVIARLEPGLVEVKKNRFAPARSAVLP